MILDYREYSILKGSEGIVHGEQYDKNTELFKHEPICPFCRVKIDSQVHQKYIETYPDWLYGSFSESETVIQCPTCGWWEYKYENSSDGMLDGIRASDIEYASAIIREYNNSSIDIPIEVLRQYLARKPEILYELDAHKMEDLVRSVFSDFYYGCSVKTFGKTRDGGKDGLIIDADGNNWLLQVKRRTRADASEGVTPLRELMGVSILEDNLKGCVLVSTADHFTRDAQKYANAVVSKKIIEAFELVDYKEFVNRLRITRESMPKEWEALLKIDK